MELNYRNIIAKAVEKTPAQIVFSSKNLEAFDVPEKVYNDSKTTGNTILLNISPRYHGADLQLRYEHLEITLLFKDIGSYRCRVAYSEIIYVQPAIEPTEFWVLNIHSDSLKTRSCEFYLLDGNTPAALKGVDVWRESLDYNPDDAISTREHLFLIHSDSTIEVSPPRLSPESLNLISNDSFSV
jgi:hypothetical protein